MVGVATGSQQLASSSVSFCHVRLDVVDVGAICVDGKVHFKRLELLFEARFLLVVVQASQEERAHVCVCVRLCACVYVCKSGL